MQLPALARQPGDPTADPPFDDVDVSGHVKASAVGTGKQAVPVGFRREIRPAGLGNPLQVTADGDDRMVAGIVELHRRPQIGYEQLAIWPDVEAAWPRLMEALDEVPP